MSINIDKFGVDPLSQLEVRVKQKVSDEEALVDLLVHLNVSKAALLRVLEECGDHGAQLLYCLLLLLFGLGDQLVFANAVQAL